MYQTITRAEIIECIVSTQRIHCNPEIKKHLIDSFELKSNREISQQYYNCMGVWLLPVMSNLFMFKN